MFDAQIAALALAADQRRALHEALAQHNASGWIEALAEGLWTVDGPLRGAVLLALAPYDQIALLQAWLKRSGTLSLSAMALEALPPALFDLSVSPKVSALDLSKNHLTELPPAFADLQQLTELDLSHNPLGTLPRTLGQLTGLRSLKLNGTGLSHLGDALGLLKWLNRLELAHNTLEALPDLFDGLEGLTLLRLDHNPLSDLPPSLGACSQLQKIALGHCAFTAIPQALFHCPQLTLIHGLPGYQTPDQQEALARAIRLAGERGLDIQALSMALFESPENLDPQWSPAVLAAHLGQLARGTPQQPPEQLLLSDDPGDVTLGLARVGTADLPEASPSLLAGLFVVAKYAGDPGLRDQARALLDRHPTPSVKAAVADRSKIPSKAQKGEKKTAAHLKTFADKCPDIDWAEVGLWLYRKMGTGLRYVMDHAPAHSAVKVKALQALLSEGRLDYYAGYATYMPDYRNSFSRYPCGHFPAEVVQMPEVTALDLRGCRLCSLPPDIAQMTQLVELNLSGNQLDDLPDTLGALTSLERLHLDDNAFNTLPLVLWQLGNLTHLTITDNRHGAQSAPLSIPDDLRVALPRCIIEI
ncbi:MAG: leucine-rich repeat domain-containing protein [Bradymonadia bacterium]